MGTGPSPGVKQLQHGAEHQLFLVLKLRMDKLFVWIRISWETFTFIFTLQFSKSYFAKLC